MGGCKEEYKQQATGVCRNHLNKIFIVQKENSFFNGGTRYWEQGKTSSRVDGRGKISWRIYTERTHTHNLDLDSVLGIKSVSGFKP